MAVVIKNRWDDSIIATVKDTDDLREAVIQLIKQGVSLRDANLSGSKLRGSNLSDIRDDMYAVLSFSPAEVPALIAALECGQVDGSTYNGECGCLVGTLAKAAGVPDGKRTCVHELTGDSGRPIEVFFFAIREGDTPENSQPAKLAHQWASEWLARMRAAFV
jgi:hypothetical protein